MNRLVKSALEGIVLEAAACTFFYAQHSEFLTYMAKEQPLDTLKCVGLFYVVCAIGMYRLNYWLSVAKDKD